MDANASPSSFDVTLSGAGAPGRWTHLRHEGEDPTPLLALGVPLTIADALNVAGARPRATRIDGGLLVVLRGVNLSPGADPEDMVSFRAWVTAAHIVTVSPRRVRAVEDVHAALAGEGAPRTSGEVLAQLATALVDRMEPVIERLNDEIEQIEEQLLERTDPELQTALGQLRRVVAQLRRHLAPQRDALLRLHHEPHAVLADGDVAALREVGDRTTRYVEDLDALRERALVLRDELDHRASSLLNRNTYLLSVVAAVFLPLGLITGLLGINVGGVPGTASESAFWVVTALLVALTLVEVWVLRRLRVV